MNNLSKSKLNSMRKQELQDLCDSWGLDVEGCKVKADYVDKVLQYQEQQGSMLPQASTTDAAAALQAPRVSPDLNHTINCQVTWHKLCRCTTGVLWCALMCASHPLNTITHPTPLCQHHTEAGCARVMHGACS